MAGSSSSNSGEKYPYPSHVCAPNFVTVKLSGRDLYGVWKTQMLLLLKSHDMIGFVDETQSPPAENTSVLGKKDMMWRRSDALVTGWILGSLSEQALKGVVNLLKANPNFSAKDVWDHLQTIYGPPPQQAAAPAAPDLDDKEAGITRELDERRIEEIEKEKGQIKAELEEKERKETKEEKKKKERAAEKLYEAILSQDIERVKRNRNELVQLTDKITINGNTALHVAVGTCTKGDFLEEMLKLATKDNQQPWDMRNSEGSTLLHVAAIVGNTEAAKMLLKKNSYLLFAKDNEGQMPLARAISNMHKDTYVYLWDFYLATRDLETGHLFDGISGCELLVNIISSKDYRSAYYLFRSGANTFLSHTDTVLMALAQNFPPKLNFWERTICRFTWLELFKFKFVEALERKDAAYRLAKLLLRRICSSIKHEGNSRSHHDYYNNAILEATRQDACKFVKIIVSEFPNAIWSTNKDGHNIIQYAVINRSEKVYNLLYQMSEHRNIYRTIKDTYENNLLHLAAISAPTNKLDPIKGAALQIQFELQWFNEVKKFVCPLNITQKNYWEDTPQMLFTKEHKELLIDGEKWMKETANSYTITAGLITTIMFAAAITVPGGNKQDNGVPVFANKTVFRIFAASDATSLFTSVTSLLIFLSINTARFSEQDFLYKLPTKLITGLTTLFISTIAMLVAFGATVFLVFGKDDSQILVPFATLICFSIACFADLQFPFIQDLMISTYGRSIFGKKSDKPFY